MSVFRVRINGENLINVINDKRIRCGFFKNEYIWAKNSNEAKIKAAEKILNKITAHPSLSIQNSKELKISIESVDTCINPFSLIKNEGFVFYEVEDDEHS